MRQLNLVARVCTILIIVCVAISLIFQIDQTTRLVLIIISSILVTVLIVLLVIVVKKRRGEK